MAFPRHSSVVRLNQVERLRHEAVYGISPRHSYNSGYMFSSHKQYFVHDIKPGY